MSRASQMGFSLIELVVSLAVIGLIFPILGQIFYQILVIAPKQSDKTQASHQLALASLWLTRDGQSAETFTALGNPEYGQYTWTDYTGSAPTQYKATYSLVGSNLVRTLAADDVTLSTFVVATDVVAYTDVAFAWSPSTRRVQVEVTVSPQGAGATEASIYDARVVTFLRPRKEPLVAPPQANPVPPPPPGSETYYVAGQPTVLQGTYVSGTNTSLNSVDSISYVIDSTIPGATKRASWEAVSQTIDAPATISQIEVRFTGRSDRSNTAVQFLVKGAGGLYPNTPDSGFTFTQADTNKTHSFFLNSDQITYIDNVRTITIKVEASNSSSFRLESDELIFIVSP